ncbi:hypothetical protein [Lactiplantibacillus pentosus]|uniref:hypothetical protein n=1 Tax=Lactiplantibacillus pentosus TaxID=1589 RepID=UPI001FFDCA91|nr:hypothetical protein [Lactiplantibacillus pentosus]
MFKAALSSELTLVVEFELLELDVVVTDESLSDGLDAEDFSTLLFDVLDSESELTSVLLSFSMDAHVEDSSWSSYSLIALSFFT